MSKLLYNGRCVVCAADIPKGSEAYMRRSADRRTKRGRPAWDIYCPSCDPRPEEERTTRTTAEPMADHARMPLNGNAGAVLANAIRAIAGESVNESRVKAIVDSALEPIQSAIDQLAESATAPRPITQIVVRDNPPITIPDGSHSALSMLVRLCAVRSPLSGLPVNIMLVGPAGTGKSYLAAQAARVLGARRFASLSMSGGISESAFLGRVTATGEFLTTEFIDVYTQGGVFCFDDVDRADENVLCALNSALANGHCSLKNGQHIERHADAVIVCTANTWGNGADREYVGANQLDAATIDRFRAARLFIDYDQTLEAHYANPELHAWALDVRRKARAAGIRRIVSSRWLYDASAIMGAGVYSLDDAKRSLLCDWTAQELKQIGEVIP